MSKSFKYTIIFIYTVISIAGFAVLLFELLKALIVHTDIAQSDLLLSLIEKIFPMLVFSIFLVSLYLLNRFWLTKDDKEEIKFINISGKILFLIFFIFTFIPNSIILKSVYDKFENHWKLDATEFEFIERSCVNAGEKFKLKSCSIIIPENLDLEKVKIAESLPINFYGEDIFERFDEEYFAFYKFFDIKSDFDYFRKLGTIGLHEVKEIKSRFGLKAAAELVQSRLISGIMTKITLIDYGTHKVVLSFSDLSKKVYNIRLFKDETTIKELMVISQDIIPEELVLKICDSFKSM